jgi:hypothetical protein
MQAAMAMMVCFMVFEDGNGIDDVSPKQQRARLGSRPCYRHLQAPLEKTRQAAPIRRDSFVFRGPMKFVGFVAGRRAFVGRKSKCEKNLPRDERGLVLRDMKCKEDDKANLDEMNRKEMEFNGSGFVCLLGFPLGRTWPALLRNDGSPILAHWPTVIA